MGLSLEHDRVRLREAGGDLDVESVVLRQADLEAGARKQLHGHLRLEALERRTAPQYGLDALVLPDHTHAVLTDLVQLERSRPQLLQRWGFGDPTSGPEYGRGTVALFHGPLGTGKTAAAGALAFELGRTLQTLTAAEVMDRYVGETAKHLRAAFDEAHARGAVLLIDEADALLAGRTGAGSATDRYGNADVDVLLHLLERHDGLVILTTNLADTLDPALQRRCRFVVGFRRPRRAERLRLWQRLIPAACPVDPGIDYGILAEHELTGAQIRDAAFRAAAWAAARPPSEQRVVVIKRC